MANEATLFEHDDGRHAVGTGTGSPAFTHDNPAWHRVGPVDVSALIAVANATPDVQAIRHTLMTGLAHNAAIAALERLALTSPVAPERELKALEALLDASMVALTDVTMATEESVAIWNNAHDVISARRLHAASPEAAPAAMEGTSPRVDALMEQWEDDGATRGPAFIELRDLARELERCAQTAATPAAPSAMRIIDADVEGDD